MPFIVVTPSLNNEISSQENFLYGAQIFLWYRIFYVDLNTFHDDLEEDTSIPT